MKKKILFLSSTRADYGKLKVLMEGVEKSEKFESYIYVTGMHLMEQYGSTYLEILKDNYKNVYISYGLNRSKNMATNMGDLIGDLSGYVQKIKPDMIVVHGDRIEAMAGAIVGALNNLIVAHVEGGELSGTIDESIRHAISKMAHIHLVCNEEAKNRLIQMGEDRKRIFVIGSPDVDLMISDKLPSIEETRRKYEIFFEKYGILIYHSVTTEVDALADNVNQLINAVIASEKNYVVILPNDDHGTELILNEYKRLSDSNVKTRFRLIPSMRFEYFLTLLKYADFIIGNSSAGIREASVYGVPAIDIGTRQRARISSRVAKNIQHAPENEKIILKAIESIEQYRKQGFYFGVGKSKERFLQVLHSDIWNLPIQKQFVDIEMRDTCS